jgi:Putative DNA-binding domain
MRSHKNLILVATIICTIFFFLVAFIQTEYLQIQARKEVFSQLVYWATEVDSALRFTDKWDLIKYRQASILAPQYYVIREDGIIIDIEGFIPQLVPTPKLSLNLQRNIVQSLTTELNEKWRVILKSVKDGNVLLGISSPNDSATTDNMLISNAKRFDDMTVNESIMLPSREIGYVVDYSVLDSSSNLMLQWGGLPTRITKDQFQELLRDSLFEKKTAHSVYLAFAKPILNRATGGIAGLILVAVDITFQQQTLRAQKFFDYIVAAICLIAMVSVIVIFVVIDERRKRKQRISITEALRIGETQTIEFKETFEADNESGEKSAAVLKSALKTVAAFLNTTGGSLFIGISDNPRELKGLQRDFRLCRKHDSDGFELKVRDLLRSHFYPAPLGKINIRFETVDGKDMCAIDVQLLRKPEVVHYDGEVYVRDGNRSLKLDGAVLTEWLKNRFHE